jgi:hypothetical protein
LSTVVIRCARAPLPISLSELSITTVATAPVAADIDELLPVIDVDGLPRIIVVGDDAALAAALTHLMRVERLDVPLGYVPDEREYGARRYKTGTGAQAATRALRGDPTETPLIRDDTGTALIGRATVVGPDGHPFEGEAYVDDTPIVRGRASQVDITANPAMPGLSARSRSGRRRKSAWVEGRAMQLGTTGAIVVRNGVPGERPVKRVAFYRHHQPWLLLH